VAFYVEHLGLGRWFPPPWIIYDRGHTPGKPAPHIYLEAAEVLGLPPAACVVVEDSLAGIAAARAAGIGRVVALGPAERHAELAALPGVDEVIVDLSRFPRHLLVTN
jgi:beta-phosphoglucomutase-like phosphatase (HAD superfamily)